MSNSGDIVRFAPSPTGYLHIGGARTALFNWLWVKKTGGKLVLRIEDTDLERNTSESVQAIFDGLNWLGIDWDLGPKDAANIKTSPYVQSNRFEFYKERVEKLISTGNAYRCYCANHTPVNNIVPVCPWRNSSKELDLPFVVRFKVPDTGVYSWNDVVFGMMKTPLKDVHDFSIMRSSGVPLYNLSTAVDDIDMGVTFVIRGKDHIINTVPQLLIYDALGAKHTKFAHLPMLMATKTEKYSKRHGAASVLEFRDQGYLPDGLLSYLARFGWAYGDEEVFNKNKLVDLFSWENVSKKDGVVDLTKAMSINGKVMKTMSTEDIVSMLSSDGPLVTDPETLHRAVEKFLPRAQTLVELKQVILDVLREPTHVGSCFSVSDQENLKSIYKLLELDDVMGKHDTATDDVLNRFFATNDLTMKDVGKQLGLALVGKEKTPNIKDIMYVLGRHKVMERIAKYIE